MRHVKRIIPIGILGTLVTVASCSSEKETNATDSTAADSGVELTVNTADSLLEAPAPPASSPWSLIPVSLDGEQWSFLDTAGNILFENEFKSMPSLPHEGYFSLAGDDGTFTVYELRDSGYNAVKNLDGFMSVGYMADGLIPVVNKDSRIEVYTKEGEKKFEALPVDSVEVTAVNPGFTEGMLCFRLANSKIGFYDTEGNVAVSPIYDEVSFFNDGLAIAGVDGGTEGMRYTIIDKEGNEKFHLAPGEHPSLLYDQAFNHGKLIATNDTIFLLYDRDGNKTAFPETIAKIEESDGQYVIFRDKDNAWGVASIDGSVLIEPRYQFISFANIEPNFGGGDAKAGFFANGTGESYILNSKGEPVATFEGAEALPFDKFGIFVFDGKEFSIMKPTGERKYEGKFKGINMNALAPYELVKSLYAPSENE